MFVSKVRPIPTLALLLCLAVLSSATPSDAQTVTRRDVPKGDVTGLEMAVEGSLRATPGGRLRWFVTVYEIVKGRNLRPASGVELKALASFHRSKPVTTARSDAGGRASLEFEVPATVDSDFTLVVQARSPKGVKRSFDVQVALTQAFRTELFVQRHRMPPGAEYRVWGRVFNVATNRPATKHEVTLGTRGGGRLVGKRLKRKTNEQGVFEALMTAPKEAGSFRVNARAKEASSASQPVTTLEPEQSRLVVRAVPVPLVAKSGSTIWVDVTVRRPDGRPVSKATLSGLSIPKSKSGKKRVPPVLTDAQGRARVPWAVRSKKELADVSASISALKEGVGVGAGKAHVRVTSLPVLVSWAVEGGALAPGLSNRLIVRATHPDGTPWAKLPVSVSGGRLETASAQTDAAGGAILETTALALDKDAPSNCQGPTLAAANLKLGPHSRAVCLPVDPDATLRVRTAPKVLAGSSFEISLDAIPGVAKRPVAITLLRHTVDERWVPILRTVTQSARSKVQLTLPPDANGPIWIRARPLWGPTLQPVRGGTAMLWAHAAPADALQVTVAASGKVQLASTGKANHSVFAMALSPADGKALVDELQAQRGHRPEISAGDAEWLGFLAAQTRADSAVSSVLRSGTAIALAMPENAVAEGLLRDPWRSRSRFVRGRLGRLMLAVEKHVLESLPDRLHNVAVRGPKGWRFNSEILTVLANEMGIEAVAGLDGNPLGISDLQKMDREFVYDNVARRLTRERLMRLLVGLRQFVNAEELDYQWARRGDPSTWLSALLDWDDPEGEYYLEPEQVYDGWGTPFAIRKAKGGRARFKFLEPIVGYEVVSAGPDGRFGSADDVYDPFARVLKANSLYGEAVGEEALLARLQGVELGRATIAALRDVFEIDPPLWEPSDQQATRQSWGRASPLVRQVKALEAQAVSDTMQSSSAFSAMQSGKAGLSLSLSPDPRRYLVVGGLYSADGSFAMAKAPLKAGAPMLIDAAMPPRLRPNEPLKIPLRVIGLDQAQLLTVDASGGGSIGVEILGDKLVSLKAGESKTIYLRLRASRVGHGTIRLQFKTPEGKLLRSYEHSLPVMWEGSMRAQHSGALTTEPATLTLAMPAKVKPVRSTLVVSAPRDLLGDSGFAAAFARYPEVMAWALTLRGKPLPEPVIAALSRRQIENRAMSTLLRAGASVAWSAMPEEDDTRTARRRAIAGLRELSAPSSLRERSALLVALASGASLLGDAGSKDPVAALVAELRRDGWHAPRTEKNRPTIMARLAAGLLLADSRDMPGKQLYRLASAQLVDGVHGGKTLPGEKGSALDAWIGTLALAIAARQLGEDEMVASLIGSVAPRFYLGMQGNVEPAFWLLAASAYGVFGIDESSTGTATVNGKRHELKFKQGVATLRLPNKSAKVVVSTSAPALARVEARYVRPQIDASDSVLAASIGGEVGHSGDIAALEVLVKNGSREEVARPIVEVLLPSAGSFGSQAIAALSAQPGILRVDAPDDAGMLRIHLGQLDAKQDRRIPLPIQWVGEGKVSGLSLSVYDANSPWKISTKARRTFHLKPAPLETWR